MSDQNRKDSLTVTISQFLTVCGLKGSEIALRSYVTEFKKRGWDGEKAKEILGKWITNNGPRLPRMKDLEELVSDGKALTTRQLAAQLAALVPQLISKHGYPWPQGLFHSQIGQYWEGAERDKAYSSFEDALSSYLGPVASLISNQWTNLCINWDENRTANLAQLRDMFEAKLASSAEMKTQVAHLLTSSENKKLLTNYEKTQGNVPIKEIMQLEQQPTSGGQDE